MCACGLYGGGDIHEGEERRMTQEVFSLPHQQNEMLEGWMQGTGSDLPPWGIPVYIFFQGHFHYATYHRIHMYIPSYLHTLTPSHPHWRTTTGFPSTSSSLVMSWSGSRSSVRLPSSSPCAYILLLMSYYGNVATSPSENQVKM